MSDFSIISNAIHEAGERRRAEVEVSQKALQQLDLEFPESEKVAKLICLVQLYDSATRRLQGLMSSAAGTGDLLRHWVDHTKELREKLNQIVESVPDDFPWPKVD